MCLTNLFKKKKTEDTISSPTLTIKHPEEPMDESRTATNTDINVVLAEWLKQWSAPEEYHTYWLSAIDIKVYDFYPDSILTMGVSQETPALTWECGNKRYLAIKPQWLNPGVIAHEQAHNSYSLLSDKQKDTFSHVLITAKGEPLVKYLFLSNSYGLTNDIEGHAEIYRYMGDTMPDYLKEYYPKLF